MDYLILDVYSDAPTVKDQLFHKQGVATGLDRYGHPDNSANLARTIPAQGDAHTLKTNKCKLY